MPNSQLAWRALYARNFAQTGERVLPLGLGTHGHGHAFGGIDLAESTTVIDAVLRSVPSDVKVMIDTAPRYGRGSVERLLGEVLRKGTDRVLIATKGGRHIDVVRDNEKDFSSSFLRADLEGSLQRLNAEKVFLLQMHNPSMEQIRRGDFFETLEGFRREGLVDWYGVSINTAAEGDAVLDARRRLRLPGLISIQAIYSILTKWDSAAMFKRAAQEGVAIIAREVLVRGLLTSRSLRYADPGASAVSKLTELYGRDQLELRRRELIQLLDSMKLSLPSAAIGFARSNPDVAVTLVGCNRVEYLSEDWPDGGNLSERTLELLSSLPDLQPISSYQSEIH